MKTVRVWFSKTGTVKYISHLDLTRCMGRALKLSGLPIWYTEGFNPRIYMTFAMPLSLGVSGERECFEIRLNEDVDYDLAVKKLDMYLPNDIKILEICEPKMRFEDIAYGKYEMLLETERPQQLLDAIENLLLEDSIIVTKRGKKGDKKIDIKPFFSDLEKKQSTNGVQINIVLPCTLEGSINPNLFLEAINNYSDLRFYPKITRKGLLTKDFSDIQ